MIVYRATFNGESRWFSSVEEAENFFSLRDPSGNVRITEVKLVTTSDILRELNTAESSAGISQNQRGIQHV